MSAASAKSAEFTWPLISEERVGLGFIGVSGRVAYTVFVR